MKPKPDNFFVLWWCDVKEGKCRWVLQDSTS
jgi:hypothetical protein